MTSQHLSDEAVAAFADGVLSGPARKRASTHAAVCAECAYAVAVQREAVWALRAAPAPSLPLGLLDRLRSVPSTTPLSGIPTAVAPDGSAMFAAFGTTAMSPRRPIAGPETGRADTLARRSRVRPLVLTAAVVAAVSAVAVGSAAQATTHQQPLPRGPVLPAGFTRVDPGAAFVAPADAGQLPGFLPDH